MKSFMIVCVVFGAIQVAQAQDLVAPPAPSIDEGSAQKSNSDKAITPIQKATPAQKAVQKEAVQKASPVQKQVQKAHVQKGKNEVTQVRVRRRLFRRRYVVPAEVSVTTPGVEVVVGPRWRNDTYAPTQDDAVRVSVRRRWMPLRFLAIR